MSFLVCFLFLFFCAGSKGCFVIFCLSCLFLLCSIFLFCFLDTSVYIATNIFHTLIFLRNLIKSHFLRKVLIIVSIYIYIYIRCQ